MSTVQRRRFKDEEIDRDYAVNAHQRLRKRQRQDEELKYCAAKKRDGGTCRQRAGYGTAHSGIGRCKYHGGSTPIHHMMEYKNEAILMGAPEDISPIDALVWCIHIVAGEVKWLTERIAEIPKNDWYEQTIMGKQFHLFVRERRDRMILLEKFSKDALALGIAERQVRLAERHAMVLARLLHNVFTDLKLTPEQQKKVPTVLRRHLDKLEGSAGSGAPFLNPEPVEVHPIVEIEAG